MSLGSRIRYFREKAGLTLEQLSDRSGVEIGTISALEVRQSNRSKYASAIANALGMTVEMLESEGEDYDVRQLIKRTGKWDGNVTEAPASPPLQEYPLISFVQAGDWAEAIDCFQPGDAESWHLSPKPLSQRGFLLRVEGHSMTNPGGGISFPPGTLLYVNPDIEALPGDYVIAKRQRENKATFKQLMQIDGELYLHAINPSWPTPYLKLEASDVIVGKIKHAGWDL